MSYDFELIEALEYKGVTDVIKKFVKSTKPKLSTIQSKFLMKFTKKISS